MTLNTQEQRQKQRLDKIASEHLSLPKEGHLTTVLSAALLFATCLMPMYQLQGASVYAFHQMFQESTWLPLSIPFLYFFGFSSFGLLLTGKFSRFGTPMSLWFS
ncbi:MAG: hypothetical protein AAGJ35_07210, partial [Myxococcota bacterium]